MPTLPPYAQWLGIRADRDETGTLRFVMPFGATTLGRPGFLHGGAIGGLLEIAAIGTLLDAVAAETPTPAVKPVTVTFDFLRGGRDHDTFAAATITRQGSRIANVEARAWQDDPARPIAAARMTLMLYRG